jgi:hypothetical protein
MREQVTPLSELRKNAVAAFLMIVAVTLGAALFVAVTHYRENDPMPHREDDAFDESGLLRDGATYRVPHRMMDALQRDVARHYDAGPLRVTDQHGSALGLHRPGWRVETGGNVGDQLVRDGLRRDAQAAYDAVKYRLSNAYLTVGNGNGDNEDDQDEEVAARQSEIHAALSTSGGSPADIEEYLEGIDNGELMTGDVGYHVRSFQSRYPSRDVAQRARDRLERLYRQRDAELAQEWRRGK